MTDEAFEALVRRLEPIAAEDPRGYERKVVWLAILGNAYLGAVAALCFVLALGAIFLFQVFSFLAVKILFFLVPFEWLMFKAMWVRMDVPQGRQIYPGEAPKLFEMIEDLRLKLDAPSFHRVLIFDEMNASVVQIPRLGILGWPRNYLMLGLPLMKALTTEQFRAVLAHEYGHLARGHGKYSNWIYCQRIRWMQLVHQLDESEHIGQLLFRPFLKRFVPYFNAYSYPLARSNEYEADAAAAHLTAPDVVAEALTNIDVASRFLEEAFWPDILDQSSQSPMPAANPFAAMGTAFVETLDSSRSQNWMRHALSMAADLSDSHPPLNDRAAAIGGEVRLALPRQGEAADKLLGSALGEITRAFDQEWKDAVRPQWEEWHQDSKKQEERLADLQTRIDRGENFELADALEYAGLIERNGNDKAEALRLFRAVHTSHPENPVACYRMGTLLLEQGNDRGIEFLECAMRLDDAAILSACELIRDYLWRLGRKEEGEKYHRKLIERADLEQDADWEREKIRTHDTFIPHGVPEETIATFVSQLKQIPGIRKAYLVRKEVKFLPERPFYIFGFACTRFHYLARRRRIEDAHRQLQKRITFPGETLIVSLEDSEAGLLKKLRKVKAGRLF